MEVVLKKVSCGECIQGSVYTIFDSKGNFFSYHRKWYPFHILTVETVHFFSLGLFKIFGQVLQMLPKGLDGSSISWEKPDTLLMKHRYAF